MTTDARLVAGRHGGRQRDVVALERAERHMVACRAAVAAQRDAECALAVYNQSMGAARTGAALADAMPAMLRAELMHCNDACTSPLSVVQRRYVAAVADDPAARRLLDTVVADRLGVLALDDPALRDGLVALDIETMALDLFDTGARRFGLPRDPRSRRIVTTGCALLVVRILRALAAATLIDRVLFARASLIDEAATAAANCALLAHDLAAQHPRWLAEPPTPTAAVDTLVAYDVVATSVRRQRRQRRRRHRPTPPDP